MKNKENYKIEDIMYEAFGTDEFHHTSKFCIHSLDKIKEYYYRYLKSNKKPSQPYMIHIIRRIPIDVDSCQLDIFNELKIEIKDIMFEVYMVDKNGLSGIYSTSNVEDVKNIVSKYFNGSISSQLYMIQIIKRIPIDFDNRQLDFFDLL